MRVPRHSTSCALIAMTNCCATSCGVIRAKNRFEYAQREFGKAGKMPDMAVSLSVQAARNKPDCSTRFETWFGANVLSSVRSKIPSSLLFPNHQFQSRPDFIDCANFYINKADW